MHANDTITTTNQPVVVTQRVMVMIADQPAEPAVANRREQEPVIAEPVIAAEPAVNVTRDEARYSMTRADKDPSLALKQKAHMKAIDDLQIDPLLKHWNVIPNNIKMPCAYHPDREVAGACFDYVMRMAGQYMTTNACGWTSEAFSVARRAAFDFKCNMVHVLWPEKAEHFQTY